jgi:hypothetical protein
MVSTINSTQSRLGKTIKMVWNMSWHLSMNGNRALVMKLLED